MIPGDINTYDTSSVFSLSETNVISVSEVLKNDVELTSGQWSYSSTTNKVTVSATLAVGDTIEIQYTYYPNYSSGEIQSYIRSALMYLSIANYFTYIVDTDGEIYPELTSKEEDLVAMIASILIAPDNKTYRLPDMTINVPNALPTRDIINKTIAIFKRDTHGVFDILEDNSDIVVD